MKKTLAVMALTFTLAWAARADFSSVQVLDAAGQVIATGTRSGPLSISGDLASGRTLRVSIRLGGVVTVRTFSLVGPVGVTEAEALRVQVGQQVLTLDAALEAEHPAEHPAPLTSAPRQPEPTHASDPQASNPGGQTARPAGEDHHAAGDDHAHSAPAPTAPASTAPDDHGAHSAAGQDDRGGHPETHPDDHGGHHGGGHP